MCLIASWKLHGNSKRNQPELPTFSGGDPLHCANRDGVKALAREIKEKYPDKNIWLYTE